MQRPQILFQSGLAWNILQFLKLLIKIQYITPLFLRSLQPTSPPPSKVPTSLPLKLMAFSSLFIVVTYTYWYICKHRYMNVTHWAYLVLLVCVYICDFMVFMVDHFVLDNQIEISSLGETNRSLITYNAMSRGETPVPPTPRCPTIATAALRFLLSKWECLLVSLFSSSLDSHDVEVSWMLPPLHFE